MNEISSSIVNGDIPPPSDNNTRYFLSFLHQQIQSYLSGFNISDVPEYIITSSWMTKTTRDKYALSHSHGNADTNPTLVFGYTQGLLISANSAAANGLGPRRPQQGLD